MTRLRRFHLRASRYGGRVAASARQGRVLSGGARVVVVVAAFLLMGGSSTVLACPVCFGAEESPMIDGARMLIAVLLGITLVVQGGFVGFFLYLRKRAKRVADVELDDEWSELQRGTRTS